MRIKNLFRPAFLLLAMVFCLLTPLYADVEIIDGTDTKTMKALFPSLSAEELSGLDRMRQQRLAHEAQCVENTTEKFVTFLFTGEFVSAQTGVDAIESRKAIVKKMLSSAPITITRRYGDHEHVLAKSKREANFNAIYSYSIHAVNDEKFFEKLKTELFEKHIQVIVRDFKLCPSGNAIFVNKGE